MIVCLCNNISEGDIRVAAAGGCKNFDEILKLYKLKFQCRVCEESARSFFKQLFKKDKK